MKLFSQVSELRAIKTICSSGDAEDVRSGARLSLTPGSLLLSQLNVAHFHYEPCKVAFERILNMLRKRSMVPTWADLTEDLSISEEYRDVLLTFTKKSVKTIDATNTLMDTLNKYRQMRILYFCAKDIIDKVKSQESDVERLMDDVSNKITLARTDCAEQDPLMILGKDANCDDFIDEVLSNKDELFIKSGVQEFDDVNGGFTKGVLLLAGTTSGGKSVLRMNMLVNMYRLNKIDVSTVSFEMDSKQEFKRQLSCITGIDYNKFRHNRLTKAEEEQARKAWRSFTKFGKKHDCRFALLCPTKGLTLEQTLMLMKPYGFRVIAIDYVSLLEGVDEDNQARILKSITRAAKIFAMANNCLVILLAQLNPEDGKIRYSRGMLEDADWCWALDYSNAADRDRRRLPIDLRKVRDGVKFNFELEEAFHRMWVGTPEDYVPPNEGMTAMNKKKDEDEDHDPLDATEVEYAVT